MRDPGARRAAVIVGAVGAAWIVIATWVGTLPPGFSAAARSPVDAALVVLVALVALGVGLADWTRDPRRTRSLSLALAGLAWPLSAGANPGSGSALVFTLALAFPYAFVPLVAHVGVGTSGSRNSPRVILPLVSLCWLGSVVLAGVVPALLFQPTLEGCRSCPPNLIGFAAMPDAARAVRAVGLAVMAGACALTAVWLMATVLRATRPARSVALPVVTPSIALLVIAACDAIVALPHGDPWPVDALWRGCAVALLATAFGVVVGWWRTVRTRQRIARLAVEIADSPTPGGLRALLAEQLRDPDLVIGYPIGDGRTVGPDGRAIVLEVRSDRQVTSLTRDGQVVALLEHRRGLADDPAHLDDVVRAARLALENGRLQAASQARLEDLRASRSLIVDTGDAARQRLERDLHDGAQQRLVSLALALRLFRPSADPADAERLAALDAAERDLRAAIEELRAVAHGLYPAVLADEGLGAGVDALRESSSVTINVADMPVERLPRPVEAAAWFAIVEATRDMDRGRIEVDVRRVDGWLLVDVVRDSPLMPDLTDVEDRIGALDGKLQVVAGHASGARLHAEIPCAS